MGCSAVHVLELQDAETVRPGTTYGYAGVAMAPDVMRFYMDSSATLGGLLSPLGEVAARVGVTENLDFGGGLWTATLPLAPVLSFQTADLGGRLGMKWMLTEREARDRVALTFALWGYGGTNMSISDNSTQKAHGLAYGVWPGVIYSRVVGSADTSGGASLYGSIRALWFHTDIHYGVTGNDTIPARETGRFVATRPAGAFGIGFGKVDGGAVEVTGMVTERLNGTGLTWSLYGGVRLLLGK